MEHDIDDGAARYVAVGDVVSGTYLVERVLGVGGTAFVVSARHLERDETFALKFLTKDVLCDAVAVERFTREARAASKLTNKHVARVHDVGTHERAPFMVMEQVRGRDLSAVLRAEGPLSVADAIAYTLQACEALDAAHVNGIAHRDVKPENLVLVENSGNSSAPYLKVLDCGISKSLADGDERRLRLRSEAPNRSPNYLSPEQIRSSLSADAQSDVWSLGVVLYELLAGAPAFSGVTVTEVCAAVLESTPRDIADFRGDVPRALVEIVARSMAKDRRRRFESMAELAAALLPFARCEARAAAERWSLRQRAATRAQHDESSPISSTPTSWCRADEMLPPSGFTPAHASSEFSRPRRNRLAAGARLAVVVTVVGAVVGLYQAMTPEPERATAAAAIPVAPPAPWTPPSPAAASANDLPVTLDAKRPVHRKAVAPIPSARAWTAGHAPSSVPPPRRRVDLGY